MASQILSGSSNPSYTNNTGQNVRLIINFMANCTSMSWGSNASPVTVTGNSSVVSKDILEVVGEFKSAEPSDATRGGNLTAFPVSASRVSGYDIYLSTRYGGVISNSTIGSSANIFYVPTLIKPGGSFPTELILENNHIFRAICGAHNMIIIREDGN